MTSVATISVLTRFFTFLGFDALGISYYGFIPGIFEPPGTLSESKGM
jgi:hypothetical protein